MSATTHDKLRPQLDQLSLHMTALANAEMELTGGIYDDLESWEEVSTTLSYIETTVESLARIARDEVRAAAQAVDDHEAGGGGE